MSSLGCIASPPVARVQFVADVGLLSIRCFFANATITNELSIGGKSDGKLEFCTRFCLAMSNEHLHKGTHVLLCALRPVIVAQIAWVRLISEYSRPIFLGELAQYKALRRYNHIESCH